MDVQLSSSEAPESGWTYGRMQAIVAGIAYTLNIADGSLRIVVPKFARLSLDLPPEADRSSVVDSLTFTVGVITCAYGIVVPAYSVLLIGGDTNA